MSKLKLSNSKFIKVITNMLGITALTTSEGKVQLTEEQRTAIKEKFGEEFLTKLEATSFDDDTSAEDNTSIFDAAVASSAAKLVKEKDTLIKDLQKQLTALVSDPEPDPQAAAVKPVAKDAPKFNINPKANYNKQVITALTSGKPANFNIELTGGIDIADLKAEFTMSIPQGAKLDILLKRIYNGFPDAKYMTQRLSKGRDFIGAGAIMSEVSQQFTSKWTPKGTAKFTPLTIPYRRHKINVEIDPTEVIDSWLIDLYTQGKTPDQQPLVLYIINNHILPKVAEDITFSMIAKGKYVKVEGAKTGDEGSAAVNSMDGFETILVEGKKKTGTKINYYKNAQNVLNLSGQALLDYVDAFTKAISPLFAKNLTVYCSREFLEAYKKADFDVYGKYTDTAIDNQVRFSKFTLIALESMYNSPILFATPKENFIELVDLAKADSCINDIHKSDYIVKIFGEYSLSTGFAIAEAVFASVPEGYVPSEAVVTGEDYGDAWVHGADPVQEDPEQDVEGA